MAEQVEGFNSYASKPPGQGLALFFEVLVEITGEVDESCGFVVNVLDIDEVVRQTANTAGFSAGQACGAFRARYAARPRRKAIEG